MKVVSITNQKGGVGKTTTSRILLEGLQKKKLKLLAIDTDKSMNLSSLFHYDDNEKTIFDLLNGDEASQCIIHTQEGIDLIQGDSRVSLIESKEIEPNLFRKKIEPLRELYDLILIDTSPDLNKMNLQTMTASDSIIIPMFADYFSMQGLAKLIKTIEATRNFTENKTLKIDGILLNQFHNIYLLNRKLFNALEKIAKDHSIKIYKSKIRQSTSIGTSQLERKEILNTSSNVAKDFQNFVDEYFKDFQKEEKEKKQNEQV